MALQVSSNTSLRPMATDAEALSPDKLFDVLDAIAVRRTWHFVKKY